MSSDQPGDKARQTAQESTNQPARLGGARADFVASLGRKVNDARGVLASVVAERGTPNEKAPREELRRRLHALGASARLLRFDSMVKAIGEAEAALDRAAQAGGATDEDLASVGHVLDDLPALAWGDGPARGQEKKPSDPPPEEVLSRTALLVGSAMLAEALTDEDLVPGAPPYECERTEDAQAAIGLARTVAPDVLVIDADVNDAAELVEALLDDPLTEPVPIVVVGSFREGGASGAARFVALGVARTLTKPITAEALRRACDEAVEQRNEVTMRVTLGEPTMEQLGERLADEVRRALIESVDAVSRGVRVPLGEGTEVMSAMWGAIARVREVVSARTGGAVRFGTAGPEGANVLAPWLSPDLPGTDRLTQAGRGRGPAADVRLHGRRVIVADDDPGVTWFIADLLRTAGCNVQEALDGTTALDLAYRTSPELVISDILMPGMDGFALTRALKRDVALRDVPVILLSWKEDLLQRVRELGANASAYLRKESDSRAIVARVRECLRPRARVEARLRTEGEVRGRLDGLTVRSLLELACAIRPDSRVGVRDASFLYEVEIRDGVPRRIGRTGADGMFERGDRALAAMLGVGAGRFTVASSNVAIPVLDRDLRGSLAEMIARPVALARAARAAITGARTMTVDRLELDVDALTTIFTPEPARSLVSALLEGASPRAMLLGGEIDPTLLEDVLGDLASRGAITKVWTHTGEEVMALAVEALLAQPQVAIPRSAPPPRMAARPSRPPVASRPPVPRAAEEALSEEDLVPSSLADAVMRELSDRAPELRPRSSNPPPIVEPSDLRPRSSNPPAAASASRMQAAAPTLPRDPMVPVVDESEGSDSKPDATEIDAPVEPSGDARLAEGGSADEKSISIRIDVGTALSAPVAPIAPPVEEAQPLTPLSAVASRETTLERPAPRARWPWVVAISLVAALVAVTMQSMNVPGDTASAGGAARNAAAAPAAMPAPAAGESSDGKGVTYDALPEGFAVPSGQGLLEVSANASLAVRVDGVARGNGPIVRVPLTAGSHEVQVAAREGQAPLPARPIEVRAGRAARVDLSVAP